MTRGTPRGARSQLAAQSAERSAARTGADLEPERSDLEPERSDLEPERRGMDRGGPRYSPATPGVCAGAFSTGTPGGALDGAERARQDRALSRP